MAEESQSIGIQLKVAIAQHLLISSVGAVLALLLLGYVLLFNPQINQIKAADRVKALQDEKQAKLAYYKSLLDLSESYKAVAPEDKEKIKAMIPPQSDIPGVLTMIEALAKNSEVGVDTMSFSEGIPIGALSSVSSLAALNVTMSFGHCSFERFELFMDALEKNLRIFDVKAVSLAPSTSSYTLNFQTYFMASGRQ